jgi:helix-turn-helix protein
MNLEVRHVRNVAAFMQLLVLVNKMENTKVVNKFSEIMLRDIDKSRESRAEVECQRHKTLLIVWQRIIT